MTATVKTQEAFIEVVENVLRARNFLPGNPTPYRLVKEVDQIADALFTNIEVNRSHAVDVLLQRRGWKQNVGSTTQKEPEER